MKQHNHEKVSQKLQQDLHNLLPLIFAFPRKHFSCCSPVYTFMRTAFFVFYTIFTLSLSNFTEIYHAEITYFPPHYLLIIML